MEAKQIRGLMEAYASIYNTTISESHFKVGDEVEIKSNGMEGEIVKVDPEGEGKYYTVKHEDGKTKKYSPDELKLDKEEEGKEKEDKGEKEEEGVSKEKKMKEEVELNEITASMGRRAKKYREDQAQAAHMASLAAHKERMENDPEYRKKHEESRTVHQRAHERSEARKRGGGEGGNQNESYDLFDYILEHLVSEGYADTNKAALAIMANMSEEWKESIVESIMSGSAPNSPTGNIGRVAGDLLKRGADLIKKNMPQSGGYSTRPGDGKPYKDGPLWDSDQKPEDVKDTPTPTSKPKPPVRKPNPPMRDEPLW